MHNVNVLVTGATGHIGSVVTERLNMNGFHVIALDDFRQGHRQALSPPTSCVRDDLDNQD